MDFKKIKRKFESDIKGVQRNNRSGFLFVTNAHIRKSEREELENIGHAESCKLTVVFGLERIVAIFDDPRAYPLRERCLGIIMTRAERIAVDHERRLEEQQERAQQARDLVEVKTMLATIMGHLGVKGTSNE